MNAFKAAKLMPLAVGGFNPKLKVTKFFGMAFPPFSSIFHQPDWSLMASHLPSFTLLCAVVLDGFGPYWPKKKYWNLWDDIT